MSDSSTLAGQVPHLSEGVVLDGCGLLVDLQVWPGTAILDPRGWLSNFRRDELVYARNMLSNFLFYAEPLVDTLFATAFQRLSALIRAPRQTMAKGANDWTKFCDTAVFTFVEGEEPNPTDSGYLFARKARQVLGIEEDRVLSPATAIKRIRGGFAQDIVFVDDFVGSGNQFVETWRRPYDVGGGTSSFSEIQKARPDSRVFYCNAVTASRGADRIERECPGVRISSGHILPEEYSWVHPQSTLWSQALRATGPAVLHQASRRAGIPDHPGSTEYWKGYSELGLGLAFAHSVPDATMPIFYWKRNGWHPLVRRA